MESASPFPLALRDLVRQRRHERPNTFSLKAAYCCGGNQTAAIIIVSS